MKIPAQRVTQGLPQTQPLREDISRGIASGCAMRVIARRLYRSASTIIHTDPKCNAPLPERDIASSWWQFLFVLELNPSHHAERARRDNSQRHPSV